MAGWRASPKSAVTHAAERGYSPSSLHNWAKELASTRSAASEVEFVRLTVAREAVADLAVEVGGARIRFSRGFDPELLCHVVEALSRREGR